MHRDPADSGGIEFPDVRTVIAAEAAAFRRLDPATRWRELFAVRRWGDRLARDPARRDTMARLWADDEARWRSIYADLIARHVG